MSGDNSEVLFSRSVLWLNTLAKYCTVNDKFTFGGMMSTILRSIALSLGAFVLSGCAIIRPGEVGVKQRLGTLDTKIHEPGSVLINPFTTKVVKVPTRTMNIEVELESPSKED